LGGGVGKLFKIGEQPINTQRQAFGNMAKPDFGPDRQLRFRIHFLFPHDMCPYKMNSTEERNHLPPPYWTKVQYTSSTVSVYRPTKSEHERKCET
jgi:hypothetical protein